jgi:uncharacterized integral membrane protein
VVGVGQIVFVLGAAVAGGLLVWWAYARFMPKRKKNGRRRY